MPPYVPAPGIVRAAMVQSVAGQQVINIFHFRSPATITPTVLQAIADGVVLWWHTNVRVLQTDDLTGIACDVTDLTTATSGVASSPVVGAPGGGVTSPGLANNAALVMTLRTAARGRSFRGRSYVGGLPQSMQTSPTSMADSYRASMQAAYLLLLNPTSFGGAILGVLTSRAGGAPRAERFTTDVTTVTSDNFIDSQRRRLSGRGA